MNVLKAMEASKPTQATIDHIIENISDIPSPYSNDPEDIGPLILNCGGLIGFKPKYPPIMRIAPITPDEACSIMRAVGHKPPDKSFDFAIQVCESEKCIGVIGMYADGETCSLGHIWTSGEALVGSVLYGAAWRCAKSLGYKMVTL